MADSKTVLMVNFDLYQKQILKRYQSFSNITGVPCLISPKAALHSCTWDCPLEKLLLRIQEYVLPRPGKVCSVSTGLQ